MSDFPAPDPGLLSTVNAEGKRLYVHPFEVKGKFQRYRRIVQWALLAFFLVLPWIQVGGRQGLLLDIYRREFALFGWFFKAHDAPLLLFPLLGFALLVALATALYGRVWCGWACPQTVFVEAIFRRIEQWIEGSASQRRKRDSEPMTMSKAWRRAAKWGVFLIVSLAITHSFLALFMGTDRMLSAMQGPPAQAWTAFSFILFSTTVILLDFGWLREQFCLFACPYGRIQSVLSDRDTRTVIYDDVRGEPRRGLTENHADCVDCRRCVLVCPTGIDIRTGAGQLECIACTACIDACDEVMQKVGKPPGLIRYDSENRVQGKQSARWRPRVILYALALVGLGFLFIGTLRLRVPFSVVVLKTRGAPFQEIKSEDGSSWIANVYHAELVNRTEEPVEAELSTDPDLKLTAPDTILRLLPGEVRQFAFVVQAPLVSFKDGSRRTRLHVKSSATPLPIETELTLVGPFR